MIKYRIHYNRKNKLKKDGTGLIQIELFDGNTRRYISSEIYIEPRYWNDKTKRISFDHRRADEYNIALNEITQSIEATLRKAKLMDKAISVDEVLAQIKDIDCNTLSDFITKEVEKDNRIKVKTKFDLLNTRNKLNEFNPTATLQDIDYKFIVDFDNHLRAKGYSINTIGKLHKNLKRFLNLAINYKILSQNDYPYRNFRVERESKKREVLNLTEVNEIEKLIYDPKSINEVVKAMFLFACYTGLRISDVKRLKNSYCTQTSNGWRLDFKSFKSGKQVYLPLHSLFPLESQASKPEQILDLYWDESKLHVFPEYPESMINRHLKEIAKQAGIKKNVTFHMGRHTFGTIMATKIPLPTLQSLMQHSDIKTTMIYVNMNNDMINSSLEKVNWKV